MYIKDHPISANTNILIIITPNYHLLYHTITTDIINNPLSITLSIVQNIKTRTTDHKNVTHYSYTIFYTWYNRNTDIVLFREGNSICYYYQ